MPKGIKKWMIKKPSDGCLPTEANRCDREHTQTQLEVTEELSDSEGQPRLFRHFF